MSAQEMGRLKMIEGLPLDMSRDCRKDLSEVARRTKARIKSPGSTCSLRKRDPPAQRTLA